MTNQEQKCCEKCIAYESLGNFKGFGASYCKTANSCKCHSSSTSLDERIKEEFLKTDWCSAYVNWCKEHLPHVIPTDHEKIADFFLSILHRELENREKEIEKNIGMMRQWLNEDRITDPKKMVTNEELKHWLTPPKK